MPKLPVMSAALLIALVAGSSLGMAMPQATQPAGDAAATDKAQSDSELLADFVHYVFIEQIAAASAMGQGLLDRKIDPVAFVKLVDASSAKRFQDAVNRAQRHDALEPISSKLLSLYESGKRATVRSAASITENIKLLTQGAAQRQFGAGRLMAAREYAMPQLLEALLQKQDGRLQAEARQLIVDMSRDAVMPLCAALPQVEPFAQQTLAYILGDIGYPAAVPFLHQIRAKSDVADVQRACDDAIRKIVGVVNEAVPVSERFVDLAENYYAESPSLTIFPGESHQLMWSYDPGAGLIMQAVDTPVYHEAMAMRLCETALREDAANPRAVPLWLASNFSREIDTPDDPAFVNVAYGSDRRDAMYYAVAAGAAPTQLVLARGLDSSDTPLVLRSLDALNETAGGSTLWAGQGERKPLLDALMYPSRQVRYEAALALGGAGPRQPFAGSEQVVRILGGAIRDAAAKYALVVSSDAERAGMIAGVLRGQGYTILPTALQLADAESSVADVPGVDLIVSSLPSAQTAELIQQAQNNAKLRATPVLGLLSTQGYTEQYARFARDQRVRLVREGVSAADMGESAKQLVDAASGGGVSPELAAEYKARSLATLRDLAVAGNTVLNVGDAAGPLIGALADATGDTKAAICEVLSHVNTKAAQQAVLDTALNAQGAERVALLGAAAGSAKRFGNQTESRQVTALRELATTGGPEEATAAAAVLGSLNLPNSEIVPLILGSGK